MQQVTKWLRGIDTHVVDDREEKEEIDDEVSKRSVHCENPKEEEDHRDDSNESESIEGSRDLNTRASSDSDFDSSSDGAISIMLDYHHYDHISNSTPHR